MRQFRLFSGIALLLLLTCGFVTSLTAQAPKSQPHHPAAAASSFDSAYPLDWVQQFVPDNKLFWDNSLNWTTNYGPAYRDVVAGPSVMLGCSTQFALCFHSGADPYPCTLSADGQSANCLCTVATTTNYTVIDSILNYSVYQATVQACGSNGSGCPQVGQAPVCSYLNNGALIPGAEVFSTFDPETRQQILKAFASANAGLTQCDKGPYAGCMTAPCQLNSDGTANCKCPVFYGRFQLVGRDAQCSLGGGLVPSASYIPVLDQNPNN